MIDLVYILGSGSAWNNNELRFSLRSVEKNLTGVRNIYVIGENPGFFSSKVTHVYHPDPLPSNNADGNMALKILCACSIPQLSEEFLFMNDDFIINKPMHAPDIPWMHKGDMKNRPHEFWVTQLYRFRLRRTFETLQMHNLPTLQYDYHAPMRMNKISFPKVMQGFDFKEGIGLTFRSLYGNALALPAEHIVNQKVTLYAPYTLEQINYRVREAMFIGYNDPGLNSSFKYWLAFNFNSKSQYEATDIENEKTFDIATWIINGRLYTSGCQLFRKHFAHKNLAYLFSEHRTPALEKKLHFKINQFIAEL